MSVGRQPNNGGLNTTGPSVHRRTVYVCWRTVYVCWRTVYVRWRTQCLSVNSLCPSADTMSVGEHQVRARRHSLEDLNTLQINFNRVSTFEKHVRKLYSHILKFFLMRKMCVHVSTSINDILQDSVLAMIYNKTQTLNLMEITLSLALHSFSSSKSISINNCLKSSMIRMTTLYVHEPKH